VCVGSGSAEGDGIDILTVLGQPGDPLEGDEHLTAWVADGMPGAGPPITLTLHGAQITWTPARAAILTTQERTTPFLLALIDFCHFENELRKLEREVAEGWPQLQLDTPLTHEVVELDPERFEAVGRSLQQTLARRMRLGRIAPHLSLPRSHLSPLANQLLDRLRDKVRVEDRVEAVGAQLEVFERVYEMASQRISDFNISRQERTLEWVIIFLLATEVVLLLIEVIRALER
jgi:hypothetical protein